MIAHAQEIIWKLEQDAFNEGFHDGWNAAAKRLNEAVKELPISRSRGNPFRQGSGQAKVYDYIRDHPGMRCKDIIARVDVSPKIVRNTLQRLKVKSLAAAAAADDDDDDREMIGDSLGVHANLGDKKG